MSTRRVGLLALVGPGVLVAATGVGAGDLSTAGFAGSKIGLAVLWAVAIGAAIKYILTEQLARWQIATGQTVLEGAVTRIGWLVVVPFVIYLLPWSFFTGAALIKACGVTLDAIAPLPNGVVMYGVACSAIGVLLVWLGGFRLFERIMAACITVMFTVVVIAALTRAPDPAEFVTGLLLPRIPDAGGEGLAWTIGLLGGIGGTLTLICYAYWMREAGREGPEHMRTCRIDLAIGYSMTAIFGIAMLVLANGMPLDTTGARLIVELAAQLEAELGPAGRWMFLAGAFGAVFSSLLGVWQAVPYVFADLWRHRGHVGTGTSVHHPVSVAGRPYRGFLLALGTVPLLGAQLNFMQVQKLYAIFGAWFIPMLALTMLVMNGKRAWIGERWRNRAWSNFALALALVLFLVVAVLSVRGMLDALTRPAGAPTPEQLPSPDQPASEPVASVAACSSALSIVGA